MTALSALGDPAPAVSYTAADYVRQDDLIAIWDGLERAPAGQEDPAVWKDLKRGLAITLVGNDCFGVNYAELYDPHVYSGITEVVEDPTATYTLEASAASLKSPVPNNGTVAIASLSYRAGINLDVREGSTPRSSFNITRPTNENYPTGKNYGVYHVVNNAAQGDILAYHTYAAAIGMSNSKIGPSNSSSVEAYDGVTNSVGYNKYGTSIGWSSTNSFYGATWASAPTGEGSIGATYAGVRIRSTRIYKGQLTADQMKANSYIDRIRFDGLTGYRVEDEKVQAWVGLNAGSGISFQADGEPVSGGLWADLDGTVTLTAVTPPGAAFAGWTGEVSAIVEGTSSDATIVVSVTKPLDLNATCQVAELVVNADTVLHADALCSGIRFTGGYSLSADPGVKVTVSDNGSGIKVDAGAATLASPVVFGTQTWGDRQLVNVAPNATLSQTGVWSGVAPILKTGAGKLELRGDNTFDGAFICTNGPVYVYSSAAFGSTVGETEIISRNNATVLYFKSSVTNSEAFYLHAHDGHTILSLDANADCELNGKVSGSPARDWPEFSLKAGDTSTAYWSHGAGSTVHLRGGHVCRGTYGGSFANNAVLCYDAPSVIGQWYRQASAGCRADVWFNANCVINNFTYDGLKGESDGLWFHLNCRDALINKDIGGYLTIDGRRYYGTLMFAKGHPLNVDLCGYDQSFLAFYQNGQHASVITSATEAVLHLTAPWNLHTANNWTATAGGTSCSASFVGAAGLSVDNNLPLTLLGASTSTGPLIASTNSLLTVTGSWAGRNVSVRAGGTLVLSSGTALSDDAVLTVDTEGGASNVQLPAGVVQTIAAVSVDGADIAPGVYGSPSNTMGATSVAWLSGKGALNVGGGVQTDGTWNPGAGGNASFVNPDNWAEGEVPEHQLGLVNVTFATAGTSVDVSEPVNVKGVIFTGDRDFTVTASGSGVFGVGGGGIEIAAPEQDASHVTTFSAPYKVNSAQTWNVPAGQRLVFNGPVTSAGDGALTFAGDGEIVFNAVNDFDGDVLFSAGHVIANASNPFGSSRGTTTILAGEGTTTCLTLADGVSVAGAVDLRPTVNRMSVSPVENGRVTFADEVGFHISSTVYYTPTNGSVTTFAGGVVGFAPLHLAGRGGPARVVVTGQPIHMTTSSGSLPSLYVESNMTLELAVPGNILQNEIVHTSRPAFVAMKGGRILCSVDRAFGFGYLEGSSYRMTHIRLGDPNGAAGTLDLNGYDQDCFVLTSTVDPTDERLRPVVTSATPATLCVSNAAEDVVCRARFGGQAALRVAGGRTYSLGAVSDTTGALTVENGSTVEFLTGASWGRSAPIYVRDGKIAISSGVARCGELFVWDEAKGGYVREAGEISAATHPDLIVGGGTLKTKSGVLLIVR